MSNKCRWFLHRREQFLTIVSRQYHNQFHVDVVFELFSMHQSKIHQHEIQNPGLIVSPPVEHRQGH